MPLRPCKSEPLYQRVKSWVLERIESGQWTESQRISSEHELIDELGVSRMTVNRALRELAEEGHVVRIVGVGSFVADRRIQMHPLEIRNIADEIAERGHAHRARVVLLRRERLGAELASQFGMKAGGAAFHSVMVHYENNAPLQWEDRFVHPAIAPGYLDCDFAQTTPAGSLLDVAPLQEVEHTVEARIPGVRIAEALGMKAGEPCLVITRRTWSKGRVASVATLFHPGSIYRLRGRFAPARSGRRRNGAGGGQS